MTLDEIKEAIDEIQNEHNGDDEAQHGCEDGLHIDFIKHVAEVGSPELKEMAKLILTVNDMDFARWCA